MSEKTAFQSLLELLRGLENHDVARLLAEVEIGTRFEKMFARQSEHEVLFREVADAYITILELAATGQIVEETTVARARATYESYKRNAYQEKEQALARISAEITDLRELIESKRAKE